MNKIRCKLIYLKHSIPNENSTSLSKHMLTMNTPFKIRLEDLRFVTMVMKNQDNLSHGGVVNTLKTYIYIFQVVHVYESS